MLMILISPIQVDEVLSKESEQDLLEGDNPGPMTEIHFWEAKSVVLDTEFDEKFMLTTVINIGMSSIIVFIPRCRNLESLFEQMKAATTIHMASILNVTDSAYYPCFRFGR